MLLKLSKFLSSDNREFEFDGLVTENNGNYDLEHLNLIFPIKYTGKICNLKTELILELDISYKYHTNCDRCLKEIEKSNEYKFVAYHYMDEFLYDESRIEEYFELYDNKLDIDDIVISSVITSMPKKNLCSEDCLGICPICGVDLNTDNCNCQNTKEYKLKEIDPRFEKLLDLFDDEEV